MFTCQKKRETPKVIFEKLYVIIKTIIEINSDKLFKDDTACTRSIKTICILYCGIIHFHVIKYCGFIKINCSFVPSSSIRSKKVF